MRRLLSPLVFSSILLAAAPGRADKPKEVKFGASYARFDGRELVIGNEQIERRWRAEPTGAMTATSIRDKRAQVEWLVGPAARPSLVPDLPLPDEPRAWSFAGRGGTFGATQEPSLQVTVAARGQTAAVEHRFQVFAAAAAIRAQTFTAGVRPPPRPDAGGGPTERRLEGPTGIEEAKIERSDPTAAERGVIERLDLAPVHTRLTQVTLVDQTDEHNELVFERTWLLHTAEHPLRLAGNLFVVEDTVRRVGMILLKEAPLPHARPVGAAFDLGVMAPRNVRQGEGPNARRLPVGPRIALLSHGTDGPGPGDASAMVLYAGGAAERTAALHEFQRQLRRYVPGRDGLFLSNTWGDRNRGNRINAAFIEKEVEAAARLGVDIVQIDDGWQRGKTKNTTPDGGVWDRFWAADPNYWEVDTTRFPRGLAPIVGAAGKKGMRFGLWFAPDSSDGLANWSRDAEAVLKLHRTLGVDYFKIDSVAFTTRAGEQNLRRFFGRVLETTRGKVVFDLDVTAQLRPGYLGLVEVGPIFVENRYTDWFRYWPHHSLRSLWSLARYVDPVRLRMEFLNNTRNTHLYGDDPLAPARYSPDYLFATTMFANPLGWFEVSELPPAYFETIAPLARKWKAHRRELHGGQIIPIGDPPDGVGWTGFASIGKGGASAHLLVFRGLDGGARWSTAVPLLAGGAVRVETIAGQGSGQMTDGRLTVQIPSTRQYVWLRVSR